MLKVKISLEADLDDSKHEFPEEAVELATATMMRKMFHGKKIKRHVRMPVSDASGEVIGQIQGRIYSVSDTAS